MGGRFTPILEQQIFVGWVATTTSWWFQVFFMFIPYLARIPILTHIFEWGWNHQLDHHQLHQLRCFWSREVAERGSTQRWKGWQRRVLLGWTVWEQEHHCHNKINVATCAISKSNRSTTTRTTRKATARARCLKSAIAKSHLVTLYFIHLIIYKKWISFQNGSFRPKKIRWKKEMARGRSDRRNLKVSKRRRNPVSDLLDPWDFFCFVWFGFGFGG